MNANLLVKPEEAAERLQISRSALYELIRDGSIRSVKINRSRRIPVDALDTFIQGLVQETEVEHGLV